MERTTVLSMLNILKKAYPSYYKDLNKDEAKDIVDFYEEMFRGEDERLVLIALKSIINTSEYPPTIATIKNKVYEISHKEEINNNDLWEALVKAIGNSSYHAEKEFNKLPELVKEYVKSPYQLQRLAEVDSEKIHSVEKGIFMKQIENIKKNYKEREMTRKNLLEERKIYYLEEEDI